MDPPGIFKILLAKKFKVERWEKFLKTMRVGETAQFASENLEDCLQYMTVSKTLRDIKSRVKTLNILEIYALYSEYSFKSTYGEVKSETSVKNIDNSFLK